MTKIKNLQTNLPEVVSKEAYYLFDTSDTPSHISYRYYLKCSNERKIEKVGLEYVTKIDNDYVPFKEIFCISLNDIDQEHPDIISHIELFLELVSLNPQKLSIK